MRFSSSTTPFGSSAGTIATSRSKAMPPAEQALRFSMYHLLAIAPTHTEHASIPARGLSGQVYKGAIFWDTEIFMLPFFTHAFPALARNLLLYRYHTLDGARRKAQEYGYPRRFLCLGESGYRRSTPARFSTSPMCSPIAPCAPISAISRCISAGISFMPSGNISPPPVMPPSGRMAARKWSSSARVSSYPIPITTRQTALRNSGCHRSGRIPRARP